MILLKRSPPESFKGKLHPYTCGNCMHIHSQIHCPFSDTQISPISKVLHFLPEQNFSGRTLPLLIAVPKLKHVEVILKYEEFCWDCQILPHLCFCRCGTKCLNNIYTGTLPHPLETHKVLHSVRVCQQGLLGKGRLANLLVGGAQQISIYSVSK